MEKPRIEEVIVVEGRYDKNTLSQVVDAAIIELGGFAVFNDKQKLSLLRRLAKERGIILFTDPDGAGFLIRNRLKGVSYDEAAGKEKRTNSTYLVQADTFAQALRNVESVMRGCNDYVTANICETRIMEVYTR